MGTGDPGASPPARYLSCCLSTLWCRGKPMRRSSSHRVCEALKRSIASILDTSESDSESSSAGSSPLQGGEGGGDAARVGGGCAHGQIVKGSESVEGMLRYGEAKAAADPLWNTVKWGKVGVLIASWNVGGGQSGILTLSYNWRICLLSSAVLSDGLGLGPGSTSPAS